MIDGAGTKHFVTLMIFMNYSSILKIGNSHIQKYIFPPGELGGGGVVGHCHICYIGTCMCHCEGYGFQAVYSGIGYINQRVLV